MRRSLDILDVLVLLDCDTTVVELGVGDRVLSIEHGTGASPVPVKASNVLETGHLFVGQVSDDLEHVATIAVNTEDIVVDEVLFPDGVLQHERSADESANDPLRLHGVCIQEFLHY